MKTYQIIFFFIILQSYHCYELLQNKPLKCIKNTTHPIYYAPYFKNSKICKYNVNYTLVPFGDNFSFNCNYDSNPPSTIAWTKVNKRTNDIDIINVQTTKFQIKSVTLEDEGHYSCIVFNDYGSIQHSFFLHVNDKPLVHPIFNHKDEQFESKIGGKIKLDCSYHSDEFSNLNFYKANKFNKFKYDELVNLNNNKQRADSLLFDINSTLIFDQLDPNLISNQFPDSLILDNLTEDSFGIYMCIADNRYGKELKFMNLKKKKTEFNYNILPYIFAILLIILIFGLIIQAYLRKKDKKKLQIEKNKNYVIMKKIIIEFEPQETDEPQPNDSDLSSYKFFPNIEIKKERKEIVGKSVADLDDYIEIELDSSWEINRERLKLDKIIGKGNFGVVQLAYLYDDPLDKQKSGYVNDDVFIDINDDNESKISETTKQLNYNYIIDHFKNNNLSNNIKTAFSNNYYGLNSNIENQQQTIQQQNINQQEQTNQQTNQFSNYIQFNGTYGQFEFMDSNNDLEITSNRLNQAKAVAVKKLKSGCNEDDIKSFVLEMIMMKCYGNHTNIINLLGCCTKNGPLYVIMEYAEKGNLKDFLKNYSSKDPNLSYLRLTTKELIQFALEIASGMQHLSLQNCIHRDLAARNVLVTSNLTMKIADFGLSRYTGGCEYYKKASNAVVPIKWLAPECIDKNLYTTQTDVWSYGVTLWELTSLGKTPYENLDPQNMYLHLKDGHRMGKPQWCNNEMYKLMSRCWIWNPKERPTFEEIIKELERIYQKELEPEYICPQSPTSETTISTICDTMCDTMGDEYMICK